MNKIDDLVVKFTKLIQSKNIEIDNSCYSIDNDSFVIEFFIDNDYNCIEIFEDETIIYVKNNTINEITFEDFENELSNY